MNGLPEEKSAAENTLWDCDTLGHQFRRHQPRRETLESTNGLIDVPLPAKYICRHCDRQAPYEGW